MTPSPAQNAREELAEWELAMQTLRTAERQLQAARRKKSLKSVYGLHSRVEVLRTRADLLLAKAVQALHDGPSRHGRS
jgi:hypothetical protein